MRLPHNHIDNFTGSIGEHREGHNLPTVPLVAQLELEGDGVPLELGDLVHGQQEIDDAVRYKEGTIGHDPVGLHRIGIGGGRSVGGCVDVQDCCLSK